MTGVGNTGYFPNTEWTVGVPAETKDPAMTVPKQAVEAAAKAVYDGYILRAVLPDAPSWNQLKDSEKEGERQIARDALTAALPLMGVEQAALPPLRAREERAPSDLANLDAAIVYYMTRGWPSYSDRERADKEWTGDKAKAQSAAFKRHLARTTNSSSGALLTGAAPAGPDGCDVAPEESARPRPDQSLSRTAGQEWRDIVQDARRYRRMQILGCMPMVDHLKHGTVLRFTNLDEVIDADLRWLPSRGEAKPLPALPVAEPKPETSR